MGQYDLSPYLNASSYSATADTAETTAFGSNARSYLASFPGGTVSLSGMFDGTSGAIDEALAAIANGSLTVPVTVAPEGPTAGKRCVVCPVQETNYTISAPVSDVVAVSTEFMYNGGLAYGYLMEAARAVSASGNGTSVDTVTTTSRGGVLNLHVTTNARVGGGTLTVVMQDSTDNVSFGAVTGGTFTAVAGGALGSQSIVLPTTTALKRYFRIAWTVAGGTSGTYTFSASAGKSN